MKKCYLKNKVTAILLLIVVTFTACGQPKKEAKVPQVPKAVAENLTAGKTFAELIEKVKQPGTVPSSTKNSFYSLVQEQKMLARNSLNTKDFSATATTESANPNLVSGILSLDSTQADAIYPNPVFYKDNKVCSSETVDNKVKRLGTYKDNNTLMINHNLAKLPKELVNEIEYNVFPVILLPNGQIYWLNSGTGKDKLEFSLTTASDKLSNHDLTNTIDNIPDVKKAAITASGSSLKALVSGTFFTLKVDLISTNDSVSAGDYEIDLVFVQKNATTWNNAIIAPFNFTYAKKECLKTTANTDGSKKVEFPGFTKTYGTMNDYFLVQYNSKTAMHKPIAENPIFVIDKFSDNITSSLPITVAHCNFTEAQFATWTSQATDIKKAREQLSWSKILNGNTCETMVYMSEPAASVASVTSNNKYYLNQWVRSDNGAFVTGSIDKQNTQCELKKNKCTEDNKTTYDNETKIKYCGKNTGGTELKDVEIKCVAGDLVDTTLQLTEANKATILFDWTEKKGSHTKFVFTLYHRDLSDSYYNFNNFTTNESKVVGLTELKDLIKNEYITKLDQPYYFWQVFSVDDANTIKAVVQRGVLEVVNGGVKIYDYDNRYYLNQWVRNDNGAWVTGSIDKQNTQCELKKNKCTEDNKTTYDNETKIKYCGKDTGGTELKDVEIKCVTGDPVGNIVQLIEENKDDDLFNWEDKKGEYKKFDFAVLPRDFTKTYVKDRMTETTTNIVGLKDFVDNENILTLKDPYYFWQVFGVDDSDLNNIKKVVIKYGVIEVKDSAITINNKNKPIVFILSGQSNMLGEGTITSLSESDKNTYSNHPENVVFNFTEPGTDVLIKSSSFDKQKNIAGNYHFGPEISLIPKLSKKYQDREVIIIKFAWGGISIKEWQSYSNTLSGISIETNKNLYNRLINYIKESIHEKGDIEYGGMFWLQGESDVGNQDYLIELKAFINKIREQLSAKNMPFVLGKIHPGNNGCPWASSDLLINNIKTIREKQLQTKSDLINIGVFDTIDLKCIDDNYDIHFNSQSNITLGGLMYDAFEEVTISDMNLSSTDENIEINYSNINLDIFDWKEFRSDYNPFYLTFGSYWANFTDGETSAGLYDFYNLYDLTNGTYKWNLYGYNGYGTATLIKSGNVEVQFPGGSYTVREVYTDNASGLTYEERIASWNNQWGYVDTGASTSSGTGATTSSGTGATTSSGTGATTCVPT